MYLQTQTKRLFIFFLIQLLNKYSGAEDFWMFKGGFENVYAEGLENTEVVFLSSSGNCSVMSARRGMTTFHDMLSGGWWGGGGTKRRSERCLPCSCGHSPMLCISGGSMSGSFPDLSRAAARATVFIYHQGLRAYWYIVLEAE